MAEWTMATVLKTVVGVSSPGVRIPLPPLQISLNDLCNQFLAGIVQRGGARVDDWGRLLSG